MKVAPIPIAVSLLLLLLSGRVGFAQSDTLVFRPVNNTILNSYDIRKITVAPDGRLWLATDNGVASFNGNDVRFYGRGDDGKGKMAHKSILRCAFDGRGNLYTIIFGGGVFYLDTRTGVVETLRMHVEAEDSSALFAPMPYTEMLVDPDYLWIGRTNMGFTGYDIAGKKTRAYRIRDAMGRMNGTVRSFLRDSRNQDIIWLGTNNGIWSFDRKTGRLVRGAVDGDILKLGAISGDTIWFSAAGRGVGWYDTRSGGYKVYPFAGGSKREEFTAPFLQRRNSEELLIGSHDRLPSVFNTRTYQYSFGTRLTAEFPGVDINHVVIDSTGNCWCVVFGQLYVAYASKSHFATYLLNDSSRAARVTNVFRNIIWDERRKCFYAAFDHSDVVFVLDSLKRVIRRISLPGSGEARVYDIALDAGGRLWSCGDGLCYYDNARGRMVPAAGLLHNAGFSRLVLQNLVVKGDWLFMQPADYSAGKFYRLNTATLVCDSFLIPESIRKENPPKSDGEKKIDELVIDRAGRYAYMGLNNSLIRVDMETAAAKTVSAYSGGYFEHFVNKFWYALDDDGKVWVATIHGIEIYDGNSLELLKTMEGEADTYYLNITNAAGTGVMSVVYSKGVLLYDYRENRRYQLSIDDGLIQLINSGMVYAHHDLFIGGELNALQSIPLAAILDRGKERTPYIAGIQVMGHPVYPDTIPQYLHEMTLAHDRNAITLSFSATEFQQAARLMYRYKLTGVDEYWRYAHYNDNTVSYNNLPPGDATFYVRVLNPDNKWSRKYASLQLHILPAWWQTAGFKLICGLAGLVCVVLIVAWRGWAVRRQEQAKSRHEKELMELEAKALRAQMDPHFIFNCMNSIKALIQKGQEDKAVTYLTTFSKLIRTIFQNSDKREVTLFDELETCRLYVQLESMRFDNKFSYAFSVDETIDLKSCTIPAMIIQPFIENAIWHGIMPKADEGSVNITVKRAVQHIVCIIDDSGIGREMSRQNKFQTNDPTHHSKGVRLTQSRIDLDNLLNKRNASLEILDKVTTEGRPAGTTVILTFTEY